MTAAETVLFEAGTGVLAGVTYGLVWFARNREKDPNNREPFDPRKLLATLIVGAVVGAGMAVTDLSLTFERFSTKMASYAGVITVVEALVKWGRDWYRNTTG